MNYNYGNRFIEIPIIKDTWAENAKPAIIFVEANDILYISPVDRELKDKRKRCIIEFKTKRPLTGYSTSTSNATIYTTLSYGELKKMLSCIVI